LLCTTGIRVLPLSLPSKQCPVISQMLLASLSTNKSFFFLKVKNIPSKIEEKTVAELMTFDFEISLFLKQFKTTNVKKEKQHSSKKESCCFSTNQPTIRLFKTWTVTFLLLNHSDF